LLADEGYFGLRVGSMKGFTFVSNLARCSASSGSAGKGACDMRGERRVMHLS
jgi:hypothetical protein